MPTVALASVFSLDLLHAALVLPVPMLSALALPALDFISLDFISLDNLEGLAREYGYWAVFLGVLLENAGLPLPGESITLVGGFLAGSGDLQVGGVLASAFGGAVLGDNLGYWLGSLGGWALLVRIGWLFRFPEEELEKARDRFQKNAAIAVTLGRFVTFLRIFAGPLAGTVAMPYSRFLVCNAAGALLWVLTIVGLAYVAGQLVPLSVLADWVARFGIVALVAVAIWVGSVVWLRRSRAVVAEADRVRANNLAATTAAEAEAKAAAKPDTDPTPNPTLAPDSTPDTPTPDPNLAPDSGSALDAIAPNADTATPDPATPLNTDPTAKTGTHSDPSAS
ncbi:MAG: VTT domain-containing protein [Prochlorothrix sp.]